MRTLLPPAEIRIRPRRKPFAHPATTALLHSKYSITKEKGGNLSISALNTRHRSERSTNITCVCWLAAHGISPSGGRSLNRVHQ